MKWVRSISQANRVRYGFAALSLLAAALAAAPAWRLHGEPGHQVFALGLAFAAAGVVALGLVAGWIIARSISGPVEETVQCVIRIAGGDLETKVESTGRDELSWLRAELNGMRKKLRGMILEVRETAGALGTATEEIARGNEDLSNRTESQAGAVQQTSHSMRQLAESVRGNAANTEEAGRMVEESSQIATRGSQLMGHVVARMGEINASAGRITEIIGVIDGIAFQTNILALNAAVEAARAGEHGRGFAVVASEVRALAQRSSTAAREIKALIDASTRTVEAGSKLVGEAGTTMREVQDSVSRMSALMGSIARAGQTQHRDIDQVHGAVAQIDGVTQHNAALVEQMAAAAQSLQGQAQRLRQAVGAFRVAT